MADIPALADEYLLTLHHLIETGGNPRTCGRVFAENNPETERGSHGRVYTHVRDSGWADILIEGGLVLDPAAIKPAGYARIEQLENPNNGGSTPSAGPTYNIRNSGIFALENSGTMTQNLGVSPEDLAALVGLIQELRQEVSEKDQETLEEVEAVLVSQTDSGPAKAIALKFANQIAGSTANTTGNAAATGVLDFIEALFRGKS